MNTRIQLRTYSTDYLCDYCITLQWIEETYKQMQPTHLINYVQDAWYCKLV